MTAGKLVTLGKAGTLWTAVIAGTLGTDGTPAKRVTLGMNGAFGTT